MADLHLAAAMAEADAAKDICADYRDAIKRILTVLVNGKAKKSKAYHIGQHFIVDGTEVVIVRTGENIAMAATVSTGNWWTDPVAVEDSLNITAGEMSKILNRSNNAWELAE